MLMQSPVVAITGANGYLGSRICEALESQGWQVIRLARTPGRTQSQALPYDLALPVTPQVRQALLSANVLIHAAYDMSVTSATDIWRVNVEGTRRLLEVATEAGVGRIIVLSSMSAFQGTSQLYGRAKLDIEAVTIEFGGCAVRPGLVYDVGAGGMTGAMRKLTTLPVVPVISGGHGVYTVQESDLIRVITALISATTVTPGTISAAHPDRVKLIDLFRAFAAEESRRCWFIPVPWRSVYWILRIGEVMRLHLPFRADSVLGLICTAPGMVGTDRLIQFGITTHAFDLKGLNAQDERETDERSRL